MSSKVAGLTGGPTFSIAEYWHTIWKLGAGAKLKIKEVARLSVSRGEKEKDIGKGVTEEQLLKVLRSTFSCLLCNMK